MLDSALVMYKSQDQSIVNSNHSDVYATKVVRSLDKGQQTIISRLEKGEKGTNLSLEFKINKQQISYIHVRKNEEKKDSEIHQQRRDEGLKIHK